MKSTTVILAAMSLALVGTAPVQAATLSFRPTTTGSGSFEGIGFTNASIVFTGTGDTDDVQEQNAGVSVLVGLPVTVTVAGVGSFAVTDVLQLVSNRFSQFAGLGNWTRLAALLFTRIGPSDYDMTTSLGPVTGSSGFNLGTPLGTAGGQITFTAFGASTYEASVAAGVPEPAGWALMIGGFGMAGASLRRRTVRTAVRVA